MTVLKLAVRLALSRDVRQRWRQVSVVGAGLVVTLLALAAVAVVGASRQSDQRIADRSAIWATGRDDAVLALSARALTLEGFGQFPVVWLEPMAGHENDPAAVPPGLQRLPAPGESVLSQGLTAAGWSADDFGFQASSAGSGPAGSIGAQGLSTRSEGFIYARPATGRTLGEGGALLYSRGYPGSSQTGISFETVPEVPVAGQALLGAAWMLIAPGAFLLFGAVRAMSPVRQQRAQTLWRLGVATRRIRWLLVTESAILLSIGAGVGVLVWAAWLQSATRIPMTVAELMPDTLAVPASTSALVLAGVVGLGAGSTAAGSIRERTVRRDARRIRPWHAVPLALAFSMMAVGPWLPGQSGARMYLLFGGLLLTFLALPMAMPALVAGLGSALGRLRHPAAWLAGRRLALRASNLSRPAAMVGALVFVAGAAFALYDRLVAAEENSGSRAPFSAFEVSWRGEQPGDAAWAIAAAGGSRAVLPVSGAEQGTPIAHLETCGDLDRWVRPIGPGCAAGTSKLDDGFRQRFRAVTGMQLDTSPAQQADSLFIVSDRGTEAREVMQLFAGRFPATNVNEVGGVSKTRDARAGWMLFGWTLATLTLVSALIREIGDRGLAAMTDTPSLLRLGLRQEEVESSYKWTLIPPLVIAIPVGFAGAVFFALLGYELGVTVGNLTRISVVAAIAGALAVVTFASVMRLQRRFVGT